MKKASITEAKNNLSALIGGLKNGSAVLIVERRRPVARLEPVMSSSEGEHDGRLSRLARDGIVRERRAVPSPALFRTQRLHANGGASVVDPLIAERREGR